MDNACGRAPTIHLCEERCVRRLWNNTFVRQTHCSGTQAGVETYRYPKWRQWYASAEQNARLLPYQFLVQQPETLCLPSTFAGHVIFWHSSILMTGISFA
jgi:hypothetical protein